MMSSTIALKSVPPHRRELTGSAFAPTEVAETAIHMTMAPTQRAAEDVILMLGNSP